jgi:hypothetical protein
MNPELSQNVHSILEFFKRNKDINQRQQFCDLEVFMFDPRLPIKSNLKCEYNTFNKFNDYNMYEDEIITTLVKNDTKKDN